MKYLSIIRYILLAISALVVVLYFMGAVPVDLMLRWAYILLGVAVLSAVLMPLLGLAQNPKGAVRSLIGLAIVAVVLGVAYSLGSSVPVETAVTTFDDPMTLKLSDTGLFAMYTALTVTIASIVVGEIANLLK